MSRATVSLALRNHASISAATRARIQKLARELGYRPNPLVSALMTHQRASKPQQTTHLTLAIVVAFSHRDAWQNYLSDDLISNAAARAEQYGYRLEEFWLGDSHMTSERLSTVLYQRSVPGLIVAPLPAAHGRLAIDWSRFSVVAIGFTHVRPPLHRVTTNRFKAMRLAVQQLRALGYRRLGLAIHADQDERVDQQWGAAFLWEQKHLPVADRTAALIATEQQWNERHFAKWFAKNRPDVVLGYGPTIIGWLEKMNIRVPADVGFAHLWNPDRSGQYAGIYHNPPAIGAAAVDSLVGMINRNERGVPEAAQTILLEADWQDGGTVKRRMRQG